MDVHDRLALERLVVDNPELEEVETRLARFNLFEASGLVRHEIRHSNFLAFLLDPSQSHALGDTFLKWLLQDTLGKKEARDLYSFSPLELHLWDLAESSVKREWRNIDILVENASLKLVVAIENKVGSGEHSNQLARYRALLERDYGPDWKVVLLLLSPEGVPATDEKFLAIGYETIHGLLSKLLDRFASQISPDIALALKHYQELLATHVIKDPELDALCDAIYRKHRRALDLIFERRAGPRALVQRTIDGWVEANLNRVVPDYTSKAYIRFVPIEWLPFSYVNNQYQGRDNRTLYVLLTNSPNRLSLSIEMNLGEPEYRQRVLEIAKEHQPPFKVSRKTPGEKYSTIFAREVLSPKDYESEEPENLAEKVRGSIEQFMSNDLPAITKVLQNGFE